VPTARPTVTVAVEPGPEQLLGRTIDDPAVTRYLSTHGCFAAMGNWNCRPASTEFAMDTGSRVTAVMLKAPGVATPEGYQGALPGGITFADSPEQLVQRLGRPVAGTAEPDGFLKWQDGPVSLFVDFFPTAPLRVHTVQLQRDT
jgi:hypothetical protein